MVKVKIGQDELWPFYADETKLNGYAKTEIELTDEEFEFYEKTFEAFYELQELLKSKYGE